ncbi:beta-D-glucosyl crocetin beta-1,6-glucosyltransferase, partial [Tanacetum coccineum]
SDKLRHDQKCKKMKLSQDMQLIQKLRHDQKPEEIKLEYSGNIVTNSRVTPSWREIVSPTFSEAGVLHVNWTSFGHCVSRMGLLLLPWLLTYVAFPFDSIYYRKYEKRNVKDVLESSANGRKDKDSVMKGVKWWKNIVLVKSFKEIKGKYGDYLSSLTSKRVVLVSLLVVDYVDVESEQNSVIQWLDTKPLDPPFPKGENNMTIKEALPLGFVERVKTKGLLVEGWASQEKILGHKNIGGFVSHSGWSLVMEAMKFGVPVIAMPMYLDQPVNGRLVVEIGIGKEGTIRVCSWGLR